jgi:rhodanese-related sulfurtransferase
MPTLSDEVKRHRIESIYQASKRFFPGVPELTPEELRDLQEKERVVLVDVRSRKERAVSIIPGAISSRDFEHDATAHGGTTLVIYCTIGVRSGLYAKKLQSRGWKAFNLKGAILAWTHSGGALVNEGSPTLKVHVGGRKFDLAADGYEPVW